MNSDSTAAYRTLSRTDLWERVRRAEGVLEHCALCPRACGVDRTSGQLGFCKTGNKPVIASWGPHLGEERPLVGFFGSGTIFFSHCNLACLSCQNWTISQGGEGREASFDTLAGIMIEIQESGCHNINFVTPTHQMPLILRSVAMAAERGLTLPLVYNCGGYESVEALKILDGVVDIYMPDFKYADPQVGLTYSDAEDYPRHAKTAIREMHRQVGDLLIDRQGIALRGLLVRHLVLPEGLAGTEEVARFLSEEVSPRTYVNIMNQYHPCHEAFRHPPLDRRTTALEHRRAVETALRAGLERIDGVTV